MEKNDNILSIFFKWSVPDLKISESKKKKKTESGIRYKLTQYYIFMLFDIVLPMIYKHKTNSTKKQWAKEIEPHNGETLSDLRIISNYLV